MEIGSENNIQEGDMGYANKRNNRFNRELGGDWDVEFALRD